jgi:hypothetical protein
MATAYLHFDQVLPAETPSILCTITFAYSSISKMNPATLTLFQPVGFFGTARHLPIVLRLKLVDTKVETRVLSRAFAGYGAQPLMPFATFYDE